MMTKAAEQIRRAALATSSRYLIDKFLDWIEQLSIVMAPAQVNRLACIEARTKARPGR
jgi:hypothetical protein